MIRGLYTSAIGMAGQLKRMDVTANNLANADTPGFRRDVVVTQSFGDVMMQRIRDYEMRGFATASGNLGPGSLGFIISSIHRDFSTGSLQPTGRPFDLALDGPGFFQVAFTDAAGETTIKYTRGGTFTLSSEGTLVTLTGHPVLNAGGGPITLSSGLVSGIVNISDDGVIFVNGEAVDTINVVSFEDATTLRAFGDSLYNITEDAVAVPFTGRIVQGFIETSNVNIVREMVEMISLSRAYEANSRMITIADQTLGQAVNDIARR